MFLNFIKKHWRGVYSLRRSFWVHGVVFYYLFSFIVSGITLLMKMSYLPIFVSMIIQIVATILFVITQVWSYVGIWRSALNHNKKIWSFLARGIVLLVIGLMINMCIHKFMGTYATYKWLVEGQQKYSYTITPSTNGEAISINGSFVAGFSDDLIRAIKENPKVNLIYIVNSVGGVTLEGRRVARIVKKYGLNTYVENMCLSSCTVVFAAGKERAIAKKAQLGFHRYTSATEWNASYSSTIEEYIDRSFMLSQGIDVNFLNIVYSVPGNEMWYPTNEEMIKSKLVTMFVDVP